MSSLYVGTIAHRRHGPVQHAFRYPIALAYFDLERPPLRRLARGTLTPAAVRERCGSGGPVHVLTGLRTFNPVAFYFCGDGVLAEVTNTPWGERHVYTVKDEFEKAFHVSPFMGMDHRYACRIVGPDERLLIHIDSFRGAERAFDATLTLERRPFALRPLLRSHPLLTLGRIYAHAVRLKLKGAAYFPHPERAA